MPLTGIVGWSIQMSCWKLCRHEQHNPNSAAAMARKRQSVPPGGITEPLQSALLGIGLWIGCPSGYLQAETQPCQSHSASRQHTLQESKAPQEAQNGLLHLKCTHVPLR